MNESTNLRRLRKRRKLSVQELQKETGVPVKVIYELERGEKRANITYVVALANYFGVSVEMLMTVYKGGDCR